MGCCLTPMQRPFNGEKEVWPVASREDGELSLSFAKRRNASTTGSVKNAEHSTWIITDYHF